MDNTPKNTDNTSEDTTPNSLDLITRALDDALLTIASAARIHGISDIETVADHRRVFDAVDKEQITLSGESLTALSFCAMFYLVLADLSEKDKEWATFFEITRHKAGNIMSWELSRLSSELARRDKDDKLT